MVQRQEDDAMVREHMLRLGLRDGWQVGYVYRELPKECRVSVNRIDDAYHAIYQEIRVGPWTWFDLVTAVATTQEGALKELVTACKSAEVESHFGSTVARRVAFVRRALKAWRQHGEE